MIKKAGLMLALAGAFGGEGYLYHNHSMGGGGSPIYFPKKKKFKGFQRENRR